ncbi:MAG: hypothetical protein JXB35_07550, partial [Anaerolineae bacterium]|nr:hypothetical protein [Anaerolineae bacterium]
MANLRRKTKRRPGGGLKAGQRRFVRRIAIPMVLYESIGVFSLVWAFALMFFEYSPGRKGGPILGLGGSNPFV